MSELSKQALKVDNNQSFPNNNNGAITPAILRSFNEDMIDSTVNQTIYTADSASFTNRIDVIGNEVDVLQAFSSSQHDLNQTLATTGSNTFNGNQVVSGSLTLSNGGVGVTIVPSAVSGGLVITDDLSIEGNLTASLPNGYVWLGNSNGKAVAVPSSSIAAGGSTDLSSLNQFTASQEILNETFATTGSNVFTAGQTILNAGIDLQGNVEGSGSAYVSFTAKVDTTSDPTNVYSGIQLVKPNGDALLNLAVNSYSPQYGTATPMILADGNNPGGNNTAIGFTPNGQMDVWKKSNFKYGADITGSLNVTGTITANEIHTIIESSSVIFSSGSNILGDDPNSDTQTLNGAVVISGSATLNGSPIVKSNQTGSFATTGSNTFTGTQTITKSGGNGLVLTDSGISSAGTILGSGNIYSLGQYAGINVQENQQGSGSQYPGINMIVAPNVYPTDIFGGFSILTELGAQAGSTFLGMASSTYSPQYNGTNVPMIIANGNNPGGNDTAIIWKSDGVAEHWKRSDFKYGINVTGSVGIRGNTTLNGAFTATIPTASNESQTNLFNFAPFVGANGTTYSSANISLQDYGSSGIDQQFVVEYANASFEKYTGLLVGPTTTGQKAGFTIGTGTGYDFDEISITDNGNNTTTALVKGDTIRIVGATQTTGSLGVSGATSLNGGLFVTGGNLLVQDNNISTNKDLTVGTNASVSGLISTNNGVDVYNQYGGISIKANAQGSGSQYPGFNLTVAPNTYPTDIYGGFNILTEQGALVGATFLGMAANSYSPQYSGTTVPMILANGNNPGGNDTAIIWTSNGNAEHWKKSLFKYGVEVTGSVNGNIVSQSIASSTASLDFGSSNFFELKLTDSAVTYVTATNVKKGQTVNLKVTQATLATGSIVFDSKFKFPAVSPYTASNGVDDIDILTFVTFSDTGSIYSAAVKNMI